mmetsp:Transcript_24807/g.60894  ORF Transcript_24807/g.60894 Transcript_24807/m.60894 type:complete len:289 (+) Transcript_24807:167-1033(+)
MGISTFVHLVTNKEATVLKSAPDSAINALIWKLCDRPGMPLPGEPAPADEEEKKVSLCAELYELLTAQPEKEEGGEGETEESEVYLESGAKFWSAKVSGSFVSIKFGKKGTDGESASHSGPDARDYFKAQVQEKLDSGYKRKDPEAAARGKAMSALKKLALVPESAAGGAGEGAAGEAASAEEAGPSRRSKRKAADDADDGGDAFVEVGQIEGPLMFPPETVIKRRCDLDKCGALCGYILSKLTQVRASDEDEAFESLMSRTGTFATGPRSLSQKRRQPASRALWRAQ